MTIPQIILLAIFLAVITAASIYVFRVKPKKATEDRYGLQPSSQEEGIAVATTAGTRAEADFRAVSNPSAPGEQPASRKPTTPR